MVDGNFSLLVSFCYDFVGYEVGYDGFINIIDEVIMFFFVRWLDFGVLFEIIEELDIGEFVLRDIIFKLVIFIN